VHLNLFAVANIINFLQFYSLGGDAMVFMTAKETAKAWGITPRRVQVLCAEGRISGAWRLGNAWAIPISTKKPHDERTLNKGNINKR